MTFTSDAAIPITSISLQGGTRSAQVLSLSVTPAAIDFGSVALSGPANSRLATVTNTGNFDVNITGSTITPAGGGFSVTGLTLGALAPGVSQTFTVPAGVTSVTASRVPALAGSNTNNDVAVQDFPAGPDTDTGSSTNMVAPGYFRTMGIPLIAGREISRNDTLSAPRVAIVNEAFAKKFNLGRQAVGKRMGDGGTGSALNIEIVGLVRDAKYSRVKDAVPPQYFLPYRQNETIGTLNFYVRTATNPEDFLANIPKVVAAIPLTVIT